MFALMFVTSRCVLEHQKVLPWVSVNEMHVLTTHLAKLCGFLCGPVYCVMLFNLGKATGFQKTYLCEVILIGVMTSKMRLV